LVTEEGIIKRVEGQRAWVVTQRSSLCDACQAQGACKVMGGGKEVEVLAVNKALGKPGDRVLLSLGEPSFLKASFLIYLVPLFLMGLGAVVGSWLSSYWATDRDLTTLIFASIFFAITLYLVRLKGKELGQKKEYLPQIISIISAN